MNNQPGGIGCDKAKLDALENQVVVDTAIIKAKNAEIERLTTRNKALEAVAEAMQLIRDRTPANKPKEWPHHHFYHTTANKALAKLKETE